MENGLNRQGTLKSIDPVVFGAGVQDNVVLSNLRSLREKIGRLMLSRCHPSRFSRWFRLCRGSIPLGQQASPSTAPPTPSTRNLSFSLHPHLKISSLFFNHFPLPPHCLPNLTYQTGIGVFLCVRPIYPIFSASPAGASPSPPPTARPSSVSTSLLPAVSSSSLSARPPSACQFNFSR